MINVPGVLAALDIKVDHVDTKSDGTVEYYARCPYHTDADGKVKVDHSPSWSIKHDSGEHYCFSCGFHGSALWLAFKVLDCTWGEANEWLEKYNNSLAEIMEMDPWDGSRPSLTQVLPINRARLMSYAEPPADALERRRLTAEACAKYNVRYDMAKHAWITPILAPDTFDLWGWQIKGVDSRLFRNLPFGVKKALTLFGIDLWDADDEVWVVESPLDAVRLWALGYRAVATFGASITKAQIRLLLKYRSLIIAFDNDNAGHKAALQLLDHARVTAMRFFAYGDCPEKDPGDMTDEEIHFGYENAKHALWGRKALGL